MTALSGVGGLEIQLVGYPSKKSLALVMTFLWKKASFIRFG
jgi:hypothetical protein